MSENILVKNIVSDFFNSKGPNYVRLNEITARMDYLDKSIKDKEVEITDAQEKLERRKKSLNELKEEFNSLITELDEIIGVISKNNSIKTE